MACHLDSVWLSAMISTITTTTVTTIVTLTSGASLGMLASMLLIALLGTKEIAAANLTNQIAPKRAYIRSFSKNLNLAILPLSVTFLLIATLKVLEVLG
jgi:hypothetical protein